MAGKNTIIGLLILMLILVTSQYIRKENQLLELQDHCTDLQSEYSRIFDEVIRLEEENQILGSYAASKDHKDE